MNTIVSIKFIFSCTDLKAKETFFVKLWRETNEIDINWAFQYLYEKASHEVRKFYAKDFVNKIAVERSGILYAKSRILGKYPMQENKLRNTSFN